MKRKMVKPLIKAIDGKAHLKKKKIIFGLFLIFLYLNKVRMFRQHRIRHGRGRIISRAPNKIQIPVDTFKHTQSRSRASNFRAKHGQTM